MLCIIFTIHLASRCFNICVFLLMFCAMCCCTYYWKRYKIVMCTQRLSRFNNLLFYVYMVHLQHEFVTPWSLSTIKNSARSPYIRCTWCVKQLFIPIVSNDLRNKTTQIYERMTVIKSMKQYICKGLYICIIMRSCTKDNHWVTSAWHLAFSSSAFQEECLPNANNHTPLTSLSIAIISPHSWRVSCPPAENVEEASVLQLLSVIDTFPRFSLAPVSLFACVNWRYSLYSTC